MYRPSVGRSRFAPVALFAALAAAFAPAAASDLSVPEHALGTGIVDRMPTGKAETFEEGARVVFWTRVVGGKPGDRIHHVWIREGEEVVSVGLSIGASHWRTYSRKRMYPGSAGDWKVEVRDAEGKVLATAPFRCTAPGGGGG